MKKLPYLLLAILSFLGFSQATPCVAAQPARRMAVIEVANFYCPHCYAVSRHLKSIKKSIVRQHGFFYFMPVALPHRSQWPMLIYLSAPKSLQAAIANRLFHAAIVDGLRMQTLSSACVAVHDALPRYAITRCKARATSKLTYQKVLKNLRLIRFMLRMQKGSSQLPLFIIVRDNHHMRILSRNDYKHVDTLIEALKHAVETTR